VDVTTGEPLAASRRPYLAPRARSLPCDSGCVKSKVPEILLKPAAAESVRRGHPWVWDKGIARGGTGLAAGAEVVLLADDGAAIGRGVFDPGSPIAVRVWSTDPREPLDEAHLAARLARAFGLRDALLGGTDTNAYRLLHGEGDRVPGVVVDRYDRVAVVRMDGTAAESTASRLRHVLVAAIERIHVGTIVQRRSEKGSKPVFEVWAGPPPPPTAVVREHGVPFVVDLLRGQKTGAFLDQRDNRRRVGAMARGKRVLNLFSYAGGFSLHAALGGATSVTSVDSAAAAHATAEESFRAAGVDPRRHEFVTADAFDFLARARERGELWDVVVSDPPSFSPSERSQARALSAYRALHRAAVRVLAPSGLFCAASCSSHVDADAFLSTLDDAVFEGRALSLLELHGPPPDHPTLAAWPEGRYLKFAVLG
jgi:23S rRNA (cytosine1962-C5)-methyltransferase